MKKIFSVAIVATIILSTILSSVYATAQEIKVNLDATKIEFDVKPQIINGRTMVPIRAIFEKMGAIVEWEASTQTAICTKEDTVVKMTVDSMDMYINDKLTRMDISPVVIGGRTLAPARFVAEAFGADVLWLADIYTVNITSYGKETLFALDGRMLTVSNSEVPAYLNVGWYRTLAETRQTLYALDGRTITVYKAEVPAYLNVGWYRTLEETQQTMYAPDGRTITVYKSEVQAYKKVGWYETESAAQSANKTAASTSNDNPSADGYYYRTPTGKKYHLDPNCGGKNSYRTTNISGLSPCSKCAR